VTLVGEPISPTQPVVAALTSVDNLREHDGLEWDGTHSFADYGEMCCSRKGWYWVAITARSNSGGFRTISANHSLDIGEETRVAGYRGGL